MEIVCELVCLFAWFRYVSRMRKGFYRFHIQNKRGAFRLRIGTRGDALSDYTLISRTYFARLCPDAGKTFGTASEAQSALAKLKAFIASHPLYSRPE